VRAGVKLRVALQPEFIRLYPNNGSA